MSREKDIEGITNIERHLNIEGERYREGYIQLAGFPFEGGVRWSSFRHSFATATLPLLPPPCYAPLTMICVFLFTALNPTTM